MPRRISECFQKPDEARVMIECHCGFGHWLTFTCEPYTDPDEEPEWEVGVVEEYRATGSLWTRLKAAWLLFWTGATQNSYVGMNRADVEQVRDWCDYVLEEEG